MMLQEEIVAALKSRVDAWRGFALGSAAEPYPEEAPRYEPNGQGERPVSPTTMALLNHWFRREPHILGVEPHTFAFKYWPHQRRLVETFIYVHEVLGLRRTEDLYRLCGKDPIQSQRDPWSKLGGQLATGSGKTKMMSLIIAWSYLNAVCEGEDRLGLGRHSILIAPGLFVKDRLLQDFKPALDGVSVFFADPVIPPDFIQYWNLNVYDPDTCPRQLDPKEGALVVTNYHQLLRTREDVEPKYETPAEKQIALLFERGDPQKLEAVRSPLIERFNKSRGLLVLNDEAHHVWDEPGHAQFEEKARQRAAAGSEEEQQAMAWIRSIRKLNGSESAPGRVGLQVDLSATLFQETGTQQAAPRRRGPSGSQVAQFKPNELFRHTIVTYDLAEAIRDGIVKKPILERVEVRNERTGEALPLVQAAAPNAWEKYKHLLITGIERWKKVRDQLTEEGDPRKPILFLLCNDRKEAAHIANFLAYGEATDQDISKTGAPVKGYADARGGPPLFIADGPDGVRRSTVVQIHIGQKEESNETEWEKVRAVVNAIDRDEVPQVQADGTTVMVPNPYNVVVSVMMLKEGWDVRNVKVIVPLRPCDSRTLTEQTLGRGLRKMHAPEIDDEGAALLKKEELYVIEHPSFAAILQQIQDIVEVKTGDEIDHPREYVAVPPQDDPERRDAVDVRLVRLEGVRHGARDWRQSFDVRKLPGITPRLPWLEEGDATQIETWLQQALEASEEKGQSFTLPAEPSYRDFDHVLEHAYSLPLLREMRASFQHKTAVKGVIQEFLETRTFKVPAGLPVAFDKIIEAGNGKVALLNLGRPEVVTSVRQALLGPLNEAIKSSQKADTADLSERRAAAIGGYQALKQNVLEALKKSPFSRLAAANPDEMRVGALLEHASDVVGWVYNHRSGVGYSIPYMWQGRSAQYFPDFVVRAKFDSVFHNFIIEVKGRLDDKDKEKARRGVQWCAILTEHDVEPWHYLMLVENAALQRQDITVWEQSSSKKLEDLLREHERLPVIPDPAQPSPFVIADSVSIEEQFRHAVPVYDLAVKAGGLDGEQAPEIQGWARVAGKALNEDMFVARVKGRSMEPGIRVGTWGLFRSFPLGKEPSSTALDNRRVVVRLARGSDAETGAYTLKRWRVTERGPSGEILQVTLKPDNGAFKSIILSPQSGDVRIVAEFVDTVG